MADHRVITTNPQATVLIWNYKDRITSDGAKDANEVSEVIINSASLLSISTSKNKANPSGSFEIRLAPTMNWVSRITVGSWLAILMTRDKFIPQISNTNPGKADEKMVKMFGRIDSVRVAIEVDQETGARRTGYVVTGRDWASVFETSLYIDPVARNNNLEKYTEVGHAWRILFENMLLEWENDKTLPSTSNVLKGIINLWGNPLPFITSELKVDGLQITSDKQFLIPQKVANYFGFDDGSSSLKNSESSYDYDNDLLNPADIRFDNFLAPNTSYSTNNPGISTGSAYINMAALIQLVDGKLKKYDEYSGDLNEAQGMPRPDTFYGTNTFWQLLTDNANTILNELVADIRWVKGKPTLALYKRIKPFATRNNFSSAPTSQISNLISNFKDVRRVHIPKEDVISINAGTNWRDKINFVELQPSQQLMKVNFDVAVKSEAQTFDNKAIQRDGFKPMIRSVYYMPFEGGDAAPFLAMEWKYLLREWYFNTHNMLNGAVNIVGQNRYIQVGDNIMIESQVIGVGKTWSKKQNASTTKTYLLAHVEGVDHNFTVNPATGARNFTTIIRFVRGIITDQKGNLISDDPAAVDRTSTDLSTENHKNYNVISTSTENDTDKQKLKGE